VTLLLLSKRILDPIYQVPAGSEITCPDLQCAIAELMAVALAEAAPVPAANDGVAQMKVRGGIAPAPALAQFIARLGSRIPDQFCAADKIGNKSNSRKKTKCLRIISPRYPE